MPFSREFERSVNLNMQEDGEPSDHGDGADMKKHLDTKEAACEEEDFELSEKKDRPPRFSTLFEGKPAPKVIERYVEPPRKRKGVYIPVPIFIILAVVLFFETTLLFAYMIIALDNNLASGLFPVGNTRVESCPQQQAINVEPKFYIGAAQSGALVGNKAPSTSPVSTTSTTTPTASGTAHKTDVVTVTPTAVTVSSVVMLSVNADGSTITPSPKTTSSSTSSSTSSVNAKKRASLQSALKSIASADATGDGKSAPVPTTLVTAKTPTQDAKTTSSAAGGGGPCFGGAGAVGLVCPDGVGRD